MVDQPEALGSLSTSCKNSTSKGKKFAVFDTYLRYLGGDFEKAVKKMEKRINEKVPALEQIAPGLSIKVQGMKGPLVEGKLPKCKEFGNKTATKIKT